jgi:hypothetical protein
MWPSLPVANHIADLANIFFIGSLVVGVASTVLIVWMANVKEGYWEHARQDSEERIASLTAQGEEAKATLGVAQADIVKATAKIAEANERTENLRKQNLLLEKAVAPRLLEQVRTAKALKPFADTRYLIKAAHDTEARRTAGQIEFMLVQAGWKKFDGPDVANLPFDEDSEGILIEWARNSLGELLPTGLPNRTLAAAREIQKQLEENGIASMVNGRKAELAPDGIRILVGLKPTSMLFLGAPGPPPTGGMEMRGNVIRQPK